MTGREIFERAAIMIRPGIKIEDSELEVLMPYIQKWEWAEPDKDESLEVYKDLPDGYQEKSQRVLRPYRHAERDWEEMYYCDGCEGWILDWPNEYPCNTLNTSHLSGKQGRDYHCRRCGRHLGFSGVMS